MSKEKKTNRMLPTKKIQVLPQWIKFVKRGLLNTKK